MAQAKGQAAQHQQVLKECSLYGFLIQTREQKLAEQQPLPSG